MPPNIPSSQQGPIRATDMPGDPTKSSQIFSVDRPGNVQPICSQASGMNRIILPNELPHIYPGTRSATLSGQQGGSEVTERLPSDNYKYIPQKSNMGKRTFAKRSSPSDWGHKNHHRSPEETKQVPGSTLGGKVEVLLQITILEKDQESKQKSPQIRTRQN